jgi:hypothetical protein
MKTIYEFLPVQIEQFLMPETFHPLLDKPLYHYTGIDGLMGMTKTHQLWPGNIHYMNDSQELKHAVELFEEHISIASSECSSLEPRKSFFLRALGGWIEEIRYEVQQHNLYVFSLSEMPSLLSQWRSYTPHGKGVSIGFSKRLIDKICNLNNCRLTKCVYTASEKTRLFNEFTQRLYLQVEKTAPNCFDNFYYCKAAIDSEKQNIFKVLALIKHEAFSEEREWRLVSTYFGDLMNAEFRPGSSMLTPYLAWQLPKYDWLFESIILGPTPHPELAMESLKAIALQKKLTESIVLSDIPYRVW